MRSNKGCFLNGRNVTWCGFKQLGPDDYFLKTFATMEDTWMSECLQKVYSNFQVILCGLLLLLLLLSLVQSYIFLRCVVSTGLLYIFGTGILTF